MIVTIIKAKTATENHEAGEELARYKTETESGGIYLAFFDGYDGVNYDVEQVER